MELSEFYGTRQWKRAREAYKKSVSGLCERCKKKGLYTPGTTVHHIIRLTPDNMTDPTIAYDPTNLELLCRDCHEKEHNRQHDSDKRRWSFDDNGNIILK